MKFKDIAGKARETLQAGVRYVKENPLECAGAAIAVIAAAKGDYGTAALATTGHVALTAAALAKARD